MDLKNSNPAEEVDMVADKTSVEKKAADMVDLEMKLYNNKIIAFGAGNLVHSESVHRSRSMKMEDDMIQEILVRLPVKSLVRCKSLSKQWRNFISYNHSFRETYISTHRSSCFLMVGFFFCKHIVYNYTFQEVFSLSTSTRGTTTPAPTLPLSLDDESLSFLGHPTINVLGSSNGFLLTCLEQEYHSTYIICNPIIKQSLVLPQPKTSSQYVTHGFICHATHPSIHMVHSYKVVRVLTPETGLLSTTRTIEIFSSNLPEWQVLNLSCPYPFKMYNLFSPLVISEQQGLIYVMVYVQKEASHLDEGILIYDHLDEGILIYDQSKECTQYMDRPPRQPDECNSGCFGMCNGLILLARYELERLHVWVLDEKEDSTREWSLKHKVRLETTMETCPQFVKSESDVGFSTEAFHPINPQLIFLDIGQNLVLFDMDTLRLELICDFRKQSRRGCYHPFPYTYGLIGPHLFLED